MDSTFMGILAMLGLRAKKINAPMYVYNADEANLALLQGLGLRKLFEFRNGDADTNVSFSIPLPSVGIGVRF